MWTRAQGLFAHATTPDAATIVVTQAKRERYKHICASEPPERVHAARRLAHPACVLAVGTSIRSPLEATGSSLPFQGPRAGAGQR